MFKYKHVQGLLKVDEKMPMILWFWFINLYIIWL